MADLEAKKRKRQSNGIDRPNKRIAGDKIKLIHLDGETGAHPVLLTAPGVKTPQVPFKAYSKPRSSKHANAPVKPSTHDLLLHSSQHPKLDYTATPTLGEDDLKHYVCIFDPASNTLQVAEAHHLTLTSTLRSEIFDLDEAEKERLSNAKQREALGSEFGTKKAKKAIAAKTENAIIGDRKGKSKITDVESAILESVGETTAGAASKASEKEIADALLAAKPIPRPNIEAEHPEQVYTFEALVGDAQQYIKIKDWQDKAKAGDAVEFKGIQYPATRLKFVADDPRKLKALKYLTLLLEFHNVLSNAGKAGKKLPKKEVVQKRLPPSRWSEQLVDSVRRRFTDESGQELGKWQMDNLYTHICALALFIDNMEVDIWLLKEDTKLDIRTLGQYFHELGARVGPVTEAERTRREMTKAQAAATRMARLKLPLQFPQTRKGRRA
ncbi:hypothetical protein AC578_9797 [Pseudocercospora eumusae]|uniref:RNA polymerase I associated factor, A49-like protein n=1 Tax=Pseudocercospora eumusae TaxID=321146 RepID=A0A139H9M5_9PEZI|nr:hypothetical protein AC578_9797 [Pseudocercospora eumusae]